MKRNKPPYIHRACVAGCGLLFAAAMAQAQVTIPTNNVVSLSQADTTKPGFLWNIFANTANQDNTLVRTENALAGKLVGSDGNPLPNLADPSQQGVAIAPGKPPSAPNGLVEFEISSVINADQAAGSSGNFTPDDQMPGIPATDGSTDGFAVEVLAWLNLPAGTIQMGVNSDDGFRVSIGGSSPQDKFGVNVGEFDGGRGAGDTIFTFKIEQAGLYAARLIYEEGGGDARVEWFTVKADGTKVLINDTANGGINAYRAVKIPARAYASRVQPAPGASGVMPTDPIQVDYVDGGTAIDPATAKLYLDGALVVSNPPKANGVISASYTPSQLLASGSGHVAAFVYTEGGTVKTQSWNFTIGAYVNCPPSAKIAGDTSKPGFIFRIFANSKNQRTTIARAEMSLNGQIFDDVEGTWLDNLASPTAVGAALGNGTGPEGGPRGLVTFEIPTVINLSQEGTDNAGNWTTDLVMPGLPSTEPSTDGVAAEIYALIELPAGPTTMGVSSDDGFRVYGGENADQPCGEFDGGRGAADSLFVVTAQEAGFYPFRLVWFEGGGGANVEWFTVKANGTKVLINDTANGGLRAARAATVPRVLKMLPLTMKRQLNEIDNKVTVLMQDGTGSPINDNTVSLKIDGNTVVTTKSRNGNLLTVSYEPSTLTLPADQHSAELTFGNAGGTFTATKSWTFRNLKKVILPATAKLSENFDSTTEGAQPAGWVPINWTANCTAGQDLADQGSDTYKDWVVIATGTIPSVDDYGIDNVNPNETLNGQPLTLEKFISGNVLYAESDSRCNTDALGQPRSGQTQFITTKPFDCSQINNVILSFSSMYVQNQDSFGGVEYSVDGGTSWLPVVYFLDVPDIKLNGDGTVNAVKTFTDSNGDTSSWTDNGVAKGGKFGDGIAAPITDALAPYVVPRLNDDRTEGKRIEVCRLPAASKKSDVRLRLSAMGTDSWYFAVDNIAFYDIDVPVPPTGGPAITGITASGGQVTITWQGGGTLESSATLQGGWTSTGDSDGSFTEPVSGGAKFYRVKR